MKLTLKTMLEKWYLLLLAIIAILSQVYFQLLLPNFMGNIQKIITYKEASPVNPINIENPITHSVFQITSSLGNDGVVNAILNQGGWMILCCVVILGCAFVQFYSASALGAHVGKRLREKMYKKVNELSLSQYNSFGTATLITRTTNDIEQVKNVTVFGTRIIIMSPAYIVIALIKVLVLEDPAPRLTLVLAICLPLVVLILLILFYFASPMFKKIQKQTDDITVVLRENLTGIRVVRAYNQQEEENKKFDKENTGMQNINIKVGRMMSIANPVISVIFNICYIGIYGFGFFLLTQIKVPMSQFEVSILSQITSVAMVAQYSMQIMQSFIMLGMILIMLPQASVSAKRIKEVLDIDTSKDEIKSKEEAINALNHKKNQTLHEFKENYKNSHNGEKLSISLLKDKYSKLTLEEKEKDPQYSYFIEYINQEEKFDDIIEQVKNANTDEYVKLIGKIFDTNPEKGVIEFKNVFFQYPDSNVPTIKDISFKTKPGTTTAIIGSTGSGKSSLINLIPRFYNPTSGEILLDGVDISKIPEKVVRDHIGFVPQTAVLFSGTIEENIKFGKEDATSEEVNEALRVAQAEHFVSKLPDGINSQVSQGGKNFSGGQKQRLAIARSLIKKPEIYIFDDSFSALDFKTDAKLRAELKDYTKGSSIIIVAQRVSSILDADNIIVLDEGKCVAQGSHAELLKTCNVYQNIVKSQLDPDEVEKTIKMNQESLKGGNL